MFSVEKNNKERYVGNNSPCNFFSKVIMRVIGEIRDDYTFKICYK